MKNIIFLLITFFLSINLWSQTGDEIIKKMEENQLHDSSIYDAVMEIHDRFGKRIKTLKIYTSGEDNVMLEFTNPEEEGQKILRLADEIYLYFPDAEEVIHLQGNALKDSVMGSDFSYEDMTDEGSVIDQYNIVNKGITDLDGHKVYKLELTATSKKAVYARQSIWVDTKLFVTRKGVFYSKSGKLLRELIVYEIKTISGKNVPTKIEMIDKMKKNSKTIFILSNLKINVPVDPDLFSLEELSW